MRKIWNKMFICTLGLLIFFSIGIVYCTVLAETSPDNTEEMGVYFGDVNGNGRIDTADLTIMRGIIYEGKYNKPEDTKKDITEEDARYRLDLDGDGEVTEYDLDLMQDYLYEEETSFPIQLMLKEITFQSLPEKQNYKKGEKLDLDGMIIKIIQNNGDYREVDISKMENMENEESGQIILECPKTDTGKLVMTNAVLKITGDTEKPGTNKVTVKYSEEYLLKGDEITEDRMLKPVEKESTFEIIVEDTSIPEPLPSDDIITIEISKKDIKITPTRKTISKKKSFNIKVALTRNVIEDRKIELEDIWEDSINSIIFRSSRSSVALVDNQGKVTGKKKGKAIITTTVILADGKKYNYKTTVYVR